LSRDGALFCWKSRSFSEEHPDTVDSREDLERSPLIWEKNSK